MHGEGEQVCIIEALADLGSFGSSCVRCLPVPVGLVPQHDRYQEIAPLDAVALLALDQPLGATEPSGRATGLSSERKIDAHPEGAAHSAHRVAGVQVRVMGTL